jgi:hypothetical protein
METKNETRADPGVEVVTALQALAVLDVVGVDRCPASDCPLCGPALPIAA